MNSIEKNNILVNKFKAVPVRMYGFKPEKTKLAVFDFDETLVQSQDMFFELNAEAMIMLNLPCTKEIVENIFNKWDKEYLGWGKNLEEQKEIYRTKFTPLVTKLSNDAYFINKMKFFEGMKETIKQLAKTDIALAIASSRDLHSILKFLQKEEVRDCFEMVEATEGGRNYKDKPHPAIVYYIAQEIGIPIERSVMIGDSPNDIKMGKNAGMKTIAVGYGKYANREKLYNENPDDFISFTDRICFVNHVKEILDFDIQYF